jgi:glycosyltransferase involved in cell wall biosynthesis
LVFLGARTRFYFHRLAEPFGLVMIEAMARGTPVVAYPS